MVEGNARWIMYLAVLVVVGLLVAMRRTKSEQPQEAARLVFVTAAILLFAVGSLFRRWGGVGHEGAAYVDQLLNPMWPEATIAAVMILSYSILRGLNLRSLFGALIVILQTALLVTSLFNTRIGDGVLARPRQLVIFLCVVFLIGILVSRILISRRNQSEKTLSRLVFMILIMSTVALSTRIDGLQTYGSWFHVGYFTGVLQTVQSGGILLWDTPSQYGFANMLLASLIPASTPEQSFLYFQALMLSLVYSVVLWVMRRTLPTLVWMSLGAIFLLLLHLTDPALHGPQPFPSTSAVRFGPSLICLAVLSAIKNPLATRSYRRFIPVLLAVACLWSFESAFYTASIVSAWILGHILESTDRKRSSLAVLRLLTTWTALLLALMATYSLWTYLAVSEWPSWQYFAIFPREYAKGFGSLPTDVFGAIWVFFLAMLSCILPISRSRSNEWPTLFASVGALCGWLSYYVGRSHSSNILNMLPLVFAAVVFAMVGMFDCRLRGVSLEVRGAESMRLMAPVFLIVVGAVSVAAVVSNPSLPQTVSRVRPLPFEAIYDPDSAAPDELNQLLRAVNLERLPVAYQGNLAMLPRLAPDVAAQLDLEGTWLPLPIRLLEIPIPVETRRVIVNRFAGRAQRSGYFVWHKGNSLLGYGEEWLNDLQAKFECEAVGASNNWQVFLCQLRNS